MPYLLAVEQVFCLNPDLVDLIVICHLGLQVTRTKPPPTLIFSENWVIFKFHSLFPMQPSLTIKLEILVTFQSLKL